MSDRTTFQVYLYECPEDQREAALGAIREVAGEWDEGAADQPGEGFTIYEARLGTAMDTAHRLAEAAPGASFYMWEDPAYEYLGDVYAYTPALGMFTAQCDSYGEPVFTLSQIEQYHNAAYGFVVTDTIRKAMGGPWREDWMAHNATPAPNGNG